MKQYENRFVRLERGCFGFMGRAAAAYQDTIRDEAQDGWHFVQVFAPPIAGFGAAPWIDLIFEREIESSAGDVSEAPPS